MNHLKKILIIVSLVISFFAFNKSVLAISDEGSGVNGACYCCGGSSGCTYDWKESNEIVGNNCTKITTKTKTTCNGSSTSSGSGACWICEPTSQSKAYRWTDDGSSPNANCYLANGVSKATCSGIPPTDMGDDSGSTDSGNDSEYEDPDGPDVGFISGDASCSGIIGSGNFHKYITDILNAMRIVAVAMVIVFSTLDFGKALITQDNDAMKKASEKTTKRLGLAIIIFFVPILLNILLGLIGIDGICI